MNNSKIITLLLFIFATNHQTLANEIINVNKQDLTTILPNNNYLVSEFSDTDNGVYLLKIFQGDGCPIMYKILHLLKNEKPFVSDVFGNCNEFVEFKTSHINNVIYLEFPALEETSRQAISYRYTIKNQKLERCDSCD